MWCVTLIPAASCNSQPAYNSEQLPGSAAALDGVLADADGERRLLVPSLTPRNVSSNPFRSGRVVRNQRQRKFFLNLQEPEHAKAAAAYVRDACRQLSARPGFRPSQLELVWMQETSQPPPLPPKPVVAVPRLRQSCG